jgi:cysteine desulfurase / selenocysteine lyase
MIYLDNSATSWPKPPCVAEVMVEFLNSVGANPGRAAHRLSVDSGRIVYSAREAVAEIFGAIDPLNVVFGLNATEGLNLAINGLVSAGDHVITSCLEHNSMMRPLRALERTGVEITVVSNRPDGCIDPADLAKEVRPNTILVAVNHASNVTGMVQPIKEIGQITRQTGLLFLVDAAQTGGAFPINMEREYIDLLAFTGHKSLLGPTGTGGLILGKRVDIKKMRPLKRGGTGSNSEHEDQPDFLPDIFESGTPNAVGLAGLNAGIRWILDHTVESIRAQEIKLTQRLIDGLSALRGVTVYGSCDASRQTGTISFNVEGYEPSDVGLILDDEHDIMCRVGLHCAPAAHKAIGTFPHGTVRFGLGVFTTEEEVDEALKVVGGLLSHRQ